MTKASKINLFRNVFVSAAKRTHSNICTVWGEATKAIHTLYVSLRMTMRSVHACTFLPRTPPSFSQLLVSLSHAFLVVIALLLAISPLSFAKPATISPTFRPFIFAPVGVGQVHE